MLIQIDNVNEFKSFPIDTNKSPEDLRNTYGSQIEGERVVVYDNYDNKYTWNYRNGRYVGE